MIRRIVLVILAFPLGAWMIFDGIHVLAYGKYFGPEKPGPWSLLVAKAGINPFQLGPLFILYGFLWLVCLFAVLRGKSWGRTVGILVSIVSLWYLPFGTITSVLCIGLLSTWKKRPGNARQ